MNVTINICIADSQSRVRFGLRVLLEQQAGWKVVGEAAEAHELLKQIYSDCPDLVLLDWDLPGMPAEILLTILRQACPKSRIIALSGRDGLRQLVLETGVDAFVSKTETPEKLITMIQQIARDAANKTDICISTIRESDESDDDYNKNSS